MATKGQMNKKAMSAMAKGRKQEINSKYERFIPELQQSGNVSSIIRRVEEIMTEVGIKRKRSPRVGKKQVCRSFTPLNWMEGELCKLGRR